MHGEQFAVMLVFLGFFFLVFGIWYLQKKEHLAMIEKGMNPRDTYRRPAPFKNLKWALLLIGAGSGLLVAFIMDEYLLVRTSTWVSSEGYVHHYRNDNPAIYFALIAIGGGLGLFGSYVMERKWLERIELTNRA
jgi:hypothetical protein